MNATRNKITEDSLLLRSLVGLLDIALLLAVVSLTYKLLEMLAGEGNIGLPLPLCLLVAVPCYVVALAFVPPILLQRTARGSVIVERLVRLCLLFALLFVAATFFLAPATGARLFVAALFALLTLVLTLERLTLRWVVKRMRRGGASKASVVLIGDPQEHTALVEALRRRVYGFALRGAFYDGEETEYLRRLGSPADVLTYLETKKRVSRVFCAAESLAPQFVDKLYAFCEANDIRFHALAPRVSALEHSMASTDLDHVVLITPRREPLWGVGNRIVKRAIDLLVSSVFLLTVFPFVYVVVALIIKAKGRGQVLNIATRQGINEKSFSCIRFNISGRVACLPEFINVLAGDMSLVGPTLTPETSEAYHTLIARYPVRHVVRPGLVGWHGEKDDDDTAMWADAKRAKADVWYMEHWNIYLDLQIMMGIRE